MYEIMIIGAGPAGITAGVYAARQKLNTLVISKDVGGQAALSGGIENYTGYQFISGPELTKKFEEHLNQFDIKLHTPEGVISAAKRDDVVWVKTDRGEYAAQALIIASGKSPRLLNVPGEKEFKNKGVTYCAVCDGPVFAGKDVAVIGAGNSALDAANQMMRIARKVYLINSDSRLRGEAVLREKVEQSGNVELVNNAVIKEILGDVFVRAVRVEVNGRTKTIPVEGVFVEIGLVPVSGFIDIAAKNEAGEIKVDTRCATNIPGIFAAGDVTDVPEKQIIVAAGEGAKAALSAAKYLSGSK